MIQFSVQAEAVTGLQREFDLAVSVNGFTLHNIDVHHAMTDIARWRRILANELDHSGFELKVPPRVKCEIGEFMGMPVHHADGFQAVAGFHMGEICIIRSGLPKEADKWHVKRCAEGRKRVD